MRRLLGVELQDDVFAFVEQLVRDTQERQDVPAAVLADDHFGLQAARLEDRADPAFALVHGGDEQPELHAAFAQRHRDLVESRRIPCMDDDARTGGGDALGSRA